MLELDLDLKSDWNPGSLQSCRGSNWDGDPVATVVSLPDFMAGQEHQGINTLLGVAFNQWQMGVGV